MIDLPVNESVNMTSAHTDVQDILSNVRKVPAGAECITDSNCTSTQTSATSSNQYCSLEGICETEESLYSFDKNPTHFQFSRDAYGVTCYRYFV